MLIPLLLVDWTIISACRNLNGYPYQHMTHMNYTNELMTFLKFSPKIVPNEKTESTALDTQIQDEYYDDELPFWF